MSAVGWASAHRPACCCFTVVAACRCFGGLKPTLLCLWLPLHRCRLNHPNRVFLFVLSIYRHIFRFPHAAAECGAVVSAVGRASAHRCRLNHPNRVFLFILSIYRHIFRFPHAAAECGAVAAHRRVGFSPPPRLPLFYCCCSLPLFRWAEAHPTERQAAVRGNIRIVSGAGLFRAAGLR